MAKIEEIKIKIVLTGGGSGGHVFPLISVFDSLKKLASEKLLSLDTLYIGPKGFGDKEFKEKGIEVKYISAGKLRRYFSIMNFFDIFKFIFGIFQSAIKLWQFMPDVIFSKGGFGSLPVILVAWVYRIPVFIHESDSIPGLSNRIASNFSKRIAVSFKKALNYFPEKKTALTGNPVRSSLFSSSPKEETKRKMGYNSKDSILLILGGSQGAKKINDLILESLEELIRNRIQIFHQTGENNFREVVAEANIILDSIPPEYRGYYKAKGFLSAQEYADILNISDIVVARAGSGTIFDISFFKKPSILIPLPNSAGNHQRENAFEYQRANASIVLEEKNILPHLLIGKILDILNTKGRKEELSENAGFFSQPDAAEKISNEIFKILGIK
jgi:UDP-N-acetylglucosamine--N-acetylmuramyl-(pentapeptide) pyrophosphoryl-undecaprenol N-acetylglucosamine transferase